MKHHFLDHYWTIESPIHAIDPRIKIVTSFIALFAIVVTPNHRFFDHMFFIPLLIALLIVSKLPIGAILRRMLVVLPLVTLIAISLPFITPGKVIFSSDFIFPIKLTDTGIITFAAVIIKATLAVWTMTLLTATTRFRDLVAGMQRLHFPTIFTSLLGFIYRYIFLFIDEAEHLNIARKSRSFGERFLLSLRGFGWMISALFVRSFSRGERIYQEMSARGFKGTYKTMTDMSVKDRDVVFAMIFVAIIVTIKVMGRNYG